MISGYSRLRMPGPAIDAVRRFHALGGTPDERMLDVLVDLCVRTGEFKTAMQVGHASER